MEANAHNNTHDVLVLESIPPQGISVGDLIELLGNETAKIGIGICLKNKSIRISNGLIYTTYI